jgi:hypothetical protein
MRARRHHFAPDRRLQSGMAVILTRPASTGAE